ncbi:hypothetical protein OROGR_027653 [Orobanche gracilis]
MPAWLGSRIGLQLGLNPLFYPFVHPLTKKISRSPQILNSLGMATQSRSAKRPTCTSCCKPTRICLCNRLPTPALDNPVAVTILQHSLEKNHPLNSTRIATLGLRNVDVITVWDVNCQARFFIYLLDRGGSVDRIRLNEGRQVFDEMPSEGEDAHEFTWKATIVNNSETGGHDSDSSRQIMANSNCSGVKRRQMCEKDEMVTAVGFTVGKYGAMVSSSIKSKVARDESLEILSLDELSASDLAVGGIKKGFLVVKRKLDNEETEEFETTIRPGSVLLFPSDKSVDIDAVNFEIKNLIVLDGTWAKAKRMYNENPWLRLLPHVRLDLDKKPSLYGEVRHQPKAGYLSTIESIVYAMKALGEEDDSEGLDGLLDVFESMIGDQRRCKNERLSKGF